MAKQNNKKKWEGWEKQEADDTPIHNFEEEPTLVGVLVDTQEGVGPNKSKLYTFEKKGGGHVKVWGSTLIDERIKDAVMGEEIGFDYLGKATSETSGRSYHNFNIYRRPIQKKE